MNTSIATERPHQGLPGRITPQQSWDATAVAEAPRPKPVPVLPKPKPKPTAPLPVFVIEPLKEADPEAAERQVPGTGSAGKIAGSIAHPAATGSQKLKVYRNGVVSLGRILFSVTKRMGGHIVIADWDLEGVIFATLDGEIIAEYGWPLEGATYVGMDKARTCFGGDGQNGELSPMS